MQRKNRTTKLTLNVRPLHKLPRGHHTHLAGAGVHADRRTRRNRDRNSQLRSSLKDQA